MDETNNNIIGTLIEPDPIKFNFTAPGWKLLLLLLFICLIIWSLIKLKRYIRNKYRREAILELNTLQKYNTEASILLFNTLAIIKRVAMISYGREQLSALATDKWLGYINNRNPSKSIFAATLEQDIIKGIYMGKQAYFSNEQLLELYQSSYNWINKHDV